MKELWFVIFTAFLCNVVGFVKQNMDSLISNRAFRLTNVYEKASD